MLEAEKKKCIETQGTPLSGKYLMDLVSGFEIQGLPMLRFCIHEFEAAKKWFDQCSKWLTM